MLSPNEDPTSHTAGRRLNESRPVMLAAPALLRDDDRTGCVERRDALVAVEHGLLGWREVHDIQRAHLWPRAAALNGGIPNHRIRPDRVSSDGRRDVDAIGVSGDEILFDDVAVGGADEADAEVVWRIEVPITARVIQPDPAVMAGDSYAAARRPRNSGAIAQRRVALHQRVE